MQFEQNPWRHPNIVSVLEFKHIGHSSSYSMIDKDCADNEFWALNSSYSNFLSKKLELHLVIGKGLDWVISR